jgi:DNA-binding CsgD family transcriptional regulator
MMDEEEPRPRTFCVMWDCNGLEAVGEVVDPALKTWAVLANKPVPREDFNVLHWQMRARTNTQRCYEIYAIGVDGNITQEDIAEMFKTDPQYAADLIRARGEKIYSDRRSQKDAII